MAPLIKIKTKFHSQCAGSFQSIPAGTDVWFDPSKKKVYLPEHKPQEDPPLKSGDNVKTLSFDRKIEWFAKIAESKGPIPKLGELSGFQNSIETFRLSCGCRHIKTRFSGKYVQGKSLKDSDSYMFCDEHSTINL